MTETVTRVQAIKESGKAFQADRKANPPKRGRPSNTDRMGPEALEAFAAAYEELREVWPEMVDLRGRHFPGVPDPAYDEAHARTVAAMQGAKQSGMTWRDCGEAMGVHHQSARSWFLRHCVPDSEEDEEVAE